MSQKDRQSYPFKGAATHLYTNEDGVESRQTWTICQGKDGCGEKVLLKYLEKHVMSHVSELVKQECWCINVHTDGHDGFCPVYLRSLPIQPSSAKATDGKQSENGWKIGAYYPFAERTLSDEEIIALSEEGWQQRFDKLWKSSNWDNLSSVEELRKEYVRFIRQELSSARQQERERIKSKVGMLRQWLNEDHIGDVNKMVTNEQIEYWLDLSSDGKKGNI